MINKLNNSGRFFAFGCSLTRCLWPTWADILGREFAQYENWARGGSGNQFIFHSLIECHKRNQFTKDDTVIIQWAATVREDRYVDDMGGWIGDGALTNQNIYSQEWLDKFSCHEGYLIRDLSLISAAQELLEKWGVQYECMSPITITSNCNSAAMTLYSDVIDNCAPTLFGVNTYITEPNISRHIRSIEETKQFYWENSYNQVAGADWPTFNDFICNTYSCSDYIQKELMLFVKQIGDNFHHPTPMDHLRYLIKYFPSIRISEETIDWVKTLRRPLLSDDELAYYHSNIPTRFNVSIT